MQVQPKEKKRDVKAKSKDGVKRKPFNKSSAPRKEKATPDVKKMKEIYNKLIIKETSLKLRRAEKTKLIDECIILAEPKHKEMSYKHD